MAAALRVTGAVATITLARPDARNAVGFDLAYTLADLARQARQRDDVWVVVIAAEGPDFCAGTDEDALAGITDDDSRLSDLRVAQMIADIEKPVICAAQGAVHEQGLEIALACDIRIADSTATFAMRQALSGSMPWDGGTQRLPRVIGRSRAVEMLLTGRELDAETALSIGLVNEVVPPSAVGRRAADIAAAIAAHGPIALRYLKEATLTGLDGTLSQGLRLEADLSFLLQSTSDRSEGISSFLQRRSPTYQNR